MYIYSLLKETDTMSPQFFPSPQGQVLFYNIIYGGPAISFSLHLTYEGYSRLRVLLLTKSS